MFRKSLDLLFATLLALTTACSGGGGGGGDSSAPNPALFPSFLAEDFDSLNAGRWRVEQDEDVAAPVPANGRLQFQWDGADPGSQARLVLKRAGFYDAAALDVPVLDSGVDVRLTIGLRAGGQDRRAVLASRRGIERIVEAVVEDGSGSEIDGESTRLSRLDVPPGASDERVRFEVDAGEGTVRFYFADELFFAYSEPGLRVPDSSQIAIEVEARDTENTAIERFEAAQLSEVPERRVTDVLASHTTPSRVQWLFKLRDAVGDVLLLDPAQAENLVPRVFEYGVPIDSSETCPVVRTLGALPLKVAIVLDHTLSMEAFGGIDAMKESAKTLLDVLSDSHEFSIWEFHDNQGEGFMQLLPPGSSRAVGKQTIDDFDPELRGFSLCWDAVAAALDTDFPEDEPAPALRVLVFFSDGVDTSSTAAPEDLVREARDRGVILYSLGYGNLTLDSRANLMMLSRETSGVFAEAPTPGEILPEFERLIDELSGYLQLAYVTGRFMDRRIESLASIEYEGRRAQQFIRGIVDGEELSFDDDGERYDPQIGVLGVSAPLLQGDDDGQTLEVLVSAAHVPRQARAFELTVRLFDLTGGGEVELPLNGPLQAQVTSEPYGPFEGWTGTRSGQVFSFEGTEACFGDFGPVLRVSIRGDELPEALRLELTGDNGIYGGLLRFAGNSDGMQDVDPTSGNWFVSRAVSP